MPASSWLPVYEVLIRHGINHATAKDIAKNDLRIWELEKIDCVLKKIKAPHRGYCYFQSPFLTLSRFNLEMFDLRRWWPSYFATEKDLTWVSPPRELMHRSAKEQLALCVNKKAEWSLRTSGYIALSHVWSEGLQRDNEHNGLLGEKFRAVFALLDSRHIEAEWIWTDVLVIPGGDPAKASSADEILTIDIINTLPLVYTHADAVIIIDALVLQLHSDYLLDVAVALVCGQWTTRVWTFQEIKLAQRALVLTATGHHEYSDIVHRLKTLADAQRDHYHSLWLRLATLERNEEVGLSIPDIVMACGTRHSGYDVDYARAFFPVLGLKWEYGMTREEGMQMIYRSQKRHAARIACFYGAPRMKINLAWAPSYLHGLEGVVTDSLEWDDRGIRGEWYLVRIKEILKKFPHSRRTALNLGLDCSGDTSMECALSANEDPKMIKVMESAIERGQTYVISLVPSEDVIEAEWARQALIIERNEVDEHDGFEGAVYCAAVILSRNRHQEDRKSILLRHGSTVEDDGLSNALQYFWHTQKESSLPATLARQDGESELHAAVRTGNVSTVANAVEEGASIAEFDKRGWTPLHTAAARGEIEILEYLLKTSPNTEIKCKSNNGETPLALAAKHGQTGSIQVLLKSGANIHARDNCDYTAIMFAALERHPEAVKELISSGANPNDSTTLGETPLLLACGAGPSRLPTIQGLIEGGASPNPPNPPTQRTPVHEVAEFGTAEELIYLLSHGSAPDERASDSYTPLFHAIVHSKADCVKLLLDAGADPGIRFSDMATPLHYAARQPNWQIMQLLLRAPKGVDVNAKTEKGGLTPLHVALKEQKTMTLVKLLWEAGADGEIEDAEGRTPVRCLFENRELLRTMPELAAAVKDIGDLGSRQRQNYS